MGQQRLFHPSRPSGLSSLETRYDTYTIIQLFASLLQSGSRRFENQKKNLLSSSSSPGYQSNGCFDFEIRFHWLLERLNLEPTHLWMDTSRMSDLLPESAVPILRSATTTTLTTFVIIHPNRHPFRSSTSSSSSTGVTTTTTTTTDRSPPPLKQTADVDRSRVDLVLKEKFGRKALCVALFSFSINLIHLGTIIVHHEIHIGSPTSC